MLTHHADLEQVRQRYVACERDKDRAALERLYGPLVRHLELLLRPRARVVRRQPAPPRRSRARATRAARRAARKAAASSGDSGDSEPPEARVAHRDDGAILVPGCGAIFLYERAGYLVAEACAYSDPGESRAVVEQRKEILGALAARLFGAGGPS